MLGREIVEGSAQIEACGLVQVLPAFKVPYKSTKAGFALVLGLLGVRVGHIMTKLY